MKANDLLDLIGNADDKMIAEAKTTRKSRKNTWVKWSAMVACLCLVVAGVFAVKGGLFSHSNKTADLPGSFLMDVSQQSQDNVSGHYQVLLSNSTYMQGDTSVMHLVSSRDGLRLQSTQHLMSVYIAPSTVQNVAGVSMSVEEAKEYAYLDYDSASPEMQEKILEARNTIIFSSDWVADGYSGCIQNVETGETVKTLPTFSELFPGWDMPTTDITNDNVTENGLGADALYGLMLRVLEINESGIVCASTEPVNIFSQNQKLTVTPPDGVSVDALSLNIGDTIFVSYYGKNYNDSEAAIKSESITKAE